MRPRSLLLVKALLTCIFALAAVVNDSAPIDDKWKGIGIRIEDDILVTENGYENLTASVPSSADQIEDLMQS